MAALSSNNNILLIFSALLWFLLLLKNVESLNINFSINAFTPYSQRLTYEGDAIVPPDEPYVRLTPRADTVGRVLYKEPVFLWDQGKQLTFETNITLQITPYPGYDKVGEGMTFFIVPVNSTKSTGGTRDNLGIYDAVVPGSRILAVEIDVASTQGKLDPWYKHIGINIDSQRSQNTTRVDDGIFGQLVTLGITYDVPTRKINVVVNYGSTTAAVSYVLNLAGYLPKLVQLGLSASASEYAAYIDVYTWHFNATMVSDRNSVNTRNNNNDTYIKQLYVGV